MMKEFKKDYEFECNIDESYKDMETDEWACAFVWLGDIGVEYNFCIDSGNNCCAIYKTEINNETDYMETDYNAFIHYEIDFDDKDWRNKLKDAMCNALEELHNLRTECITVYAFTVPGHEDDDDFINITVNRKIAEQYYEETQEKTGTHGNIDKDHYDCFDDWNNDYICDDTMDFYEYAMKRNAILNID